MYPIASVTDQKVPHCVRRLSVCSFSVPFLPFSLIFSTRHVGASLTLLCLTFIHLIWPPCFRPMVWHGPPKIPLYDLTILAYHTHLHFLFGFLEGKTVSIHFDCWPLRLYGLFYACISDLTVSSSGGDGLLHFRSLSLILLYRYVVYVHILQTPVSLITPCTQSSQLLPDF